MTVNQTPPASPASPPGKETDPARATRVTNVTRGFRYGVRPTKFAVPEQSLGVAYPHPRPPNPPTDENVE